MSVTLTFPGSQITAFRSGALFASLGGNTTSPLDPAWMVNPSANGDFVSNLRLSSRGEFYFDIGGAGKDLKPERIADLTFEFTIPSIPAAPTLRLMINDPDGIEPYTTNFASGTDEYTALESFVRYAVGVAQNSNSARLPPYSDVQLRISEPAMLITGGAATGADATAEITLADIEETDVSGAASTGADANSAVTVEDIIPITVAGEASTGIDAAANVVAEDFTPIDTAGVASTGIDATGEITLADQEELFATLPAGAATRVGRLNWEDRTNGLGLWLPPTWFTENSSQRIDRITLNDDGVFFIDFNGSPSFATGVAESAWLTLTPVDGSGSLLIQGIVGDSTDPFLTFPSNQTELTTWVDRLTAAGVGTGPAVTAEFEFVQATDIEGTASAGLQSSADLTIQDIPELETSGIASTGIDASMILTVPAVIVPISGSASTGIQASTTLTVPDFVPIEAAGAASTSIQANTPLTITEIPANYLDVSGQARTGIQSTGRVELFDAPTVDQPMVGWTLSITGLDGQTVYWWSGEGTISINSISYQGVTKNGQAFLQVSAIEQTQGPPTRRAAVRMAVVPETTRRLLQQDYGPLPIRIGWVASSDSGRTWRALPRSFEGRLSSPKLLNGIYECEVETLLGDSDRGAPIRWSYEDHLARHPNDGFFEAAASYATGLQTKWPP